MDGSCDAGPLSMQQPSAHGAGDGKENEPLDDAMDDLWADTLPCKRCSAGLAVPRQPQPQPFALPRALELDGLDDAWADDIPAKKACVVRALGEPPSSSSTAIAFDGREGKEAVRTAPQTYQSGHTPPAVPTEYCIFSGRVVEVHAEDDATEGIFAEIFCRRRFEAAFPEAKGLPLVVGLDFEWKPDKKRDDNNPIALMQLGCWDTVLVVRTTGCKSLPAWMVGFLEDDGVLKVTASFDLSDKDKLRTSFGWDFGVRGRPATFVDVAELAKARQVPHGMFKMANFFDTPMLKNKAVGSSNWAREGVLTDQQRQYAADDAFFQLFLMGRILERNPAGPDDSSSARAHEVWRLTQSSMEACIKRVDNRDYRRVFFELRELVREGVDQISRSLGSGGCASVVAVNALPSVRNYVESTKGTCAVSVGTNFLKQNMDIFVVFFKEQQVKVRLRSADDSDGEGPKDEQEQVDDEEFLAEVIELLLKYEPPLEKRQSVLNRTVPEPFWVPARAVLSKQQLRRLESIGGPTECLDTCYAGDDGLLLRLARHPRAADDQEHLERCVAQLQKDLGLDEAEAKRRLNGDEKFMQAWGALRILESGSDEEAHLERTFQARLRILGDAERVSARVDPPASWEECREGLEKVKWYRRLLGDCMGSSREEVDAEVKVCLDAVVAVWPDVKGLKSPQELVASAQKEKKGKAKGKDGKGKGKGKGKAKGKNNSK